MTAVARVAPDPGEAMLANGEFHVTDRPAYKIKESHIRCAMLVALGHKNVDIARETGYSPGAIAGWKREEWFQELIQNWQGITEKDFDNKLGVMRSAFDEVMQAIRERIENGEMDNRSLVDLAKTIAPKIGIQDAPQVVQHGIESETLKELRAARDEQREGRVVQAQAKLVPEEDC